MSTHAGFTILDKDGKAVAVYTEDAGTNNQIQAKANFGYPPSPGMHMSFEHQGYTVVRSTTTTENK